MEEYGTLESFLLQEVIKFGHKPVAIAYMDGEECFIFETKKEADAAADDFMPEGYWYTRESFEADRDKYIDILFDSKEEGLQAIQLIEIPAEMTMTPEEKEAIRIAKIEAAKVAAVEEIQRKLKAQPVIEAVKSCELCKHCTNMTKDRVRSCSKLSIQVAGHESCSEWEELERKVGGGSLKITKARKARARHFAHDAAVILLESGVEFDPIVQKGWAYKFVLSSEGKLAYQRARTNSSIADSEWSVPHVIHKNGDSPFWDFFYKKIKEIPFKV